MLYHHDAASYDFTAAKAKMWATNKLDQMIANGRRNTQATLEKVDQTIIEDAIVPAQRMHFFPTEEGQVRVTAGDRDFGIHPHAMGQVMQRLGGTKRVMDWAYEPDTAMEFSSILNKKMSQQGDRRFLKRSVNGKMLGLLSDRYRRLDSRLLVGSLIEEAIGNHGAVPIEANMLDTSFSMKLVLPQLFEPLPNEVGVFGIAMRNSDYGAGRYYLRGFFNRLWCTNCAMTEDGISQVHLGGRLSENIAFSQRTYELDSQTMASATKDIVDNIFSKSNINQRMEAIQEAARGDSQVDVGKELKRLASGGKLLKAEAKQVAEAYNGPDVELLPPGNNKWRLSNAISLIAQTAEPDRQLELESMAGSVAGLVCA